MVALSLLLLACCVCGYASVKLLVLRLTPDGRSNHVPAVRVWSLNQPAY